MQGFYKQNVASISMENLENLISNIKNKNCTSPACVSEINLLHNAIVKYNIDSIDEVRRKPTGHYCSTVYLTDDFELKISWTYNERGRFS